MTGATVTTAPNNLNSTSGWVVGATAQCGGGGGASFNGVTTALPDTNAGSAAPSWAGPASAALHLATGSNGGCTVHVDSGVFAINTGKTYVLKVLARSTGGTAAGATVQMNASFYKWAPPSHAVNGAVSLQPSMLLAETTLLWRATSTFTAELWEQLMVMMPTPADGAFASVRFAVSGGAAVDLFALSIA